MNSSRGSAMMRRLTSVGVFAMASAMYLHFCPCSSFYAFAFVIHPMLKIQQHKLWGATNNPEDLSSSNNSDSSSEQVSQSSLSHPLPEGEPTLQQTIDEQRRQIEMLMRIMKYSNTQQQPSPTSIQQPSLQTETSSPTQAQAQLVPLKAMMFIDGTWLYYSIHQRQETHCPITKRFGRGWQHYYRVDWAALPRLVCEQIQQSIYDPESSYSDRDKHTLLRPMEITRNSVYTSYNKGTDKNSFRVKMFDQMQQANFDVHIMETLGREEKCVDIQLAIEMLHYATVPDAYDVAILLSGDKDFVPALVRTRQKGKRVAIVSMKTGCNRALYESPHVKDYNIVWIDNFLDKLIRPIHNNNNVQKSATSGPRLVSHITMMKVIYDFILRSYEETSTRRVESRQVGRHLKNVEIGDETGGTTNLLLQLKQVYGGLRLFLLQYPTVFRVFDKDPDPSNPRDKSFWIEAILKDTDEEKAEIAIDDQSDDMKTTVKSFVEEGVDLIRTTSTTSTVSSNAELLSEDIPEKRQNQKLVVRVNYEDTMDYSKLTLIQLKEICREWGVPVSGTKAVLLGRIQQDVRKRAVQLTGIPTTIHFPPFSSQELASETTNNSPPLKSSFQRASRILKRSPSGRLKASSRSKSDRSFADREDEDIFTSSRNSVSKTLDGAVVDHLDNLMDDYLKASGGQVGSRDMGRYLAANSSSKKQRGNEEVSSALTELKQEFGSLANYISNREGKFVRLDVDGPYQEHGFLIASCETKKKIGE